MFTKQPWISFCLLSRLFVNGTPIIIYNRNRLSSNTTSTAIYDSPTVTSDGTQLDFDKISGTSKHTGGEVQGIPAEWIVDSGNTYIIKVTNNDNSNADVLFKLFFYELSV